MHSTRYEQGQRVMWITVFLNIILGAFKVIVGFVYNSNALIADGIHTISDVFSSIGLIIGLIIAKKPRDIDHQYGHEKAESISALILSLILIAVGINICYSSIKLIINPSDIKPGNLAIVAAVLSIIIKEVQFRIAINTGKKIQSTALIADAWHHRSDALSSIGALIGIIGSRLGFSILDPIAGVIVSIIVIKAGFDIFKSSYEELMDTSLDTEILSSLIDKIIAHEGVRTINDIKARKHGNQYFVDVIIAVNPNITVAMGHKIAEDVENIVYNNINAKDVMVHVNPCCNVDITDCADCSQILNDLIKRKLKK
ncbi:cation diffusion facilitator family transporter [Clostridiaceae bacterium M8S5]|nr:cation diffusion facilitator family transporter [Clostridiaceae bacterium M8S5]